jgi:hypothetical protein
MRGSDAEVFLARPNPLTPTLSPPGRGSSLSAPLLGIFLIKAA